MYKRTRSTIQENVNLVLQVRVRKCVFVSAPSNIHACSFILLQRHVCTCVKFMYGRVYFGGRAQCVWGGGGGEGTGGSPAGPPDP